MMSRWRRLLAGWCPNHSSLSLDLLSCNSPVSLRGPRRCSAFYRVSARRCASLELIRVMCVMSSGRWCPRTSVCWKEADLALAGRSTRAAHRRRVGRPRPARQHREWAAFELRQAPKEKRSEGASGPVDTSGHLLAAHVSAAHENERAHVEQLLSNGQEAAGESVEVASVDGGYNGAAVAAAAQEPGGASGGGQLAAGQEGLRALAPALGGRTLLRGDGEMPSPVARRDDERLLLHAGRPALRRLRQAQAHASAGQ